MSHAKAITAALVAVLAAVAPAFATAAPLGFAGWVNVVVLAAGALHVYNASNDIPGWQYAKLIAALVSAGAVVLSSALSDGGVSTAEWIQVAVAALGAFAVYQVPNQAGPAGGSARGRHAAPDPLEEPPV